MIDLPNEFLFPLKNLRNHYRELISTHTKEMADLIEQTRICGEKLQESEDAFNHVNCLIPSDSDNPSDSLLDGYVEMALATEARSEQLSIEFEQLPDEFESIKKILSMYPGTLCDVKFVVKMLYENPTSDTHNRIANVLKNGADQGMWYAIPDNQNCFTIDINLIQLDTVEPRIEARGRRRKA
jgi:hypothetical protein